jgi:Uma2 family endonuclease
MNTTTDTTLAHAAATSPFVLGAPPVRRFTVDEYHRMVETGILSENDRVELLDGWILEMSPIGPPHATSVGLLCAALAELMPPGWLVRAQAPVTLATGEPEPDVTIVRGGLRDYRDRHPGPSDVALVVEVADTSLEYDRRQKRIQYALSGIRTYWIINLLDRQLEVYREPVDGEYHVHEVVDANGSVELLIDGTAISRLPLSELLP